MREIGQTGQVICRCGRVAELRTRKNGQRLPFLMCKSCGMQQGKEELRQEWLAKEDPTCSLGKFGEFPESSNNTNELVEVEQTTSSNKQPESWKPPLELEPEKIETKAEQTSEDTRESSKKGVSLFAKVGLGVLGALALGFGVKKFKFSKAVKG